MHLEHERAVSRDSASEPQPRKENFDLALEFGSIIGHESLADPVPDALLQTVLDDARYTPPNCNVQPWVVHIASGATRDQLSKATLSAAAEGRFTPDFPWRSDDFYGAYKERAQAQGAAYHQAPGIERDEAEVCRISLLRNLEFFGAPYVCLLFIQAANFLNRL